MAEAHAVASALVFRALLPPHPAFSLGERENRPSLRGESNTLGRASVSALNRGANGASVVEFIRGSQTNRCFERCFPLTPVLSLGERENGSTRFRQSRAPRLVAARDALFPLPKGEGKSEGERDAANRNGQTIIAGSNRLARRGRIGYHIEPRACRWSKGARSQTHRCFERAFPLTPPSPLGRGSVARRAFANPERLDLSPRGMRYSLSLRERVRVRGNGTQPTETARRLLQAQIDWLAESGLAIISSPEPVDGRRARGRKRTGVSSVASPSPQPSPLGRGRMA